MADFTELYFVARTDIGSDTGQQRVFGVADTEDEAVKQRDQIAAGRIGTFAVFKGAVVDLQETSPAT